MIHQFERPGADNGGLARRMEPRRRRSRAPRPTPTASRRARTGFTALVLAGVLVVALPDAGAQNGGSSSTRSSSKSSTSVPSRKSTSTPTTVLTAPKQGTSSSKSSSSKSSSRQVVVEQVIVRQVVVEQVVEPYVGIEEVELEGRRPQGVAEGRPSGRRRPGGADRRAAGRLRHRVGAGDVGGDRRPASHGQGDCGGREGHGRSRRGPPVRRRRLRQAAGERIAGGALAEAGRRGVLRQRGARDRRR